jgi:transcriptional regulator with XRE-family HTH domain
VTGPAGTVVSDGNRTVIDGRRESVATDVASKSREKGVPVPVLRQVVGDTLRALRMRQRRTLREVSGAARVSLGYLSEIERGQKEPSSELLAAICGALDVELSELFAEVSQTLRREEKLAPTNRVKLIGSPIPGGAARITPAPPADGSTATATQVRSLPTVAA